MKPEQRMHPLVYQSVKRYLGYRWGNAIIQDLLRFRFGLKISVRCLKTIREDGACSIQSQSLCPFRQNVM